MATANEEVTMTKEEQRQANLWLANYLQRTLTDGSREIAKLRGKLAVTYWILIFLSVVMFIVGVALISIPAWAAFRGQISELKSLIAAGFGLADLVGLFLSRPIERAHHLMGDMGQITLAIGSFQSQMALRLLEMDKDNRPTIGKAADDIKGATETSIELIQKYFEAKKVAA